MSLEIKSRIFASEFIFNEAFSHQYHAPTIVETDEGLLAAWFGGMYESHSDVCIYKSARIDGKWNIPEKVADGITNDGTHYPCWNPVLFRKDNGEIILYYKVGASPREWWGMYKISKDNGRSWSEAFKIPDNLLGPVRNKPVALKGGTVLYPSSYETSQHWRVYIEKSDQELKNWGKTDINNNGFNAIQPTILYYGDERFQILCRSKEKSIVESWSDDSGKTWSPLQATSLPSNNSGIDGVSVENDLQLLVLNPTDRGRYRLVIVASHDGKNWHEVTVLENNPVADFNYASVIEGKKASSEFSYPAIIKGQDGKIHITYTYNRETIKYVQLEIYVKKN